MARYIYGFETAFGGWFIESDECITTLNLQKSNFSNVFYLNIKIYVKGMFGNIYKKNKSLLKDTGDVFRRQPKEYDYLFDLEDPIDDLLRSQKMNELFKNFIFPFSKQSLTKAGLKKLAQEGLVIILPAVATQFEILTNS